MVYIIGKCSLLIIILEFEVIDIPELNIHQLAALLNSSKSACQIYSIVAFCFFEYLHVWKSVIWRIKQWKTPF